MRSAPLLLAPLMLAACLFESTDAQRAHDGVPMRDQWRVELDAPVVLEGEAALKQLLIGGREFEGNFANRGDVIVKFHAQDRILVEMRRFTRAESAARAQEDFDALSLWAFIGGDQGPMLESEMQFPRPCVGETGTLRDRCGLRVWFDGHVQPERTGADLRVTLPARWAGDLNVITEDSIIDSDYLNRGNVCIEPTRARVTAQLGRGMALGSIAPGELLDPDQPPPALSFFSDAAEAWMDVPAELRTTVQAGYEADAAKDERCYADPVLEGFVDLGGSFSATRGSISGVAGPDPEPEALDAELQARADTCALVAFTESPDAWTGQSGEQDTEVRGAVHFCNDCLRTQPCEDLLPGD